ncbi:SDR family oxidoreductase [Halapricum sp. CBA1109]|uniref:SDR family NAD(P)-dependent oxidoreductase n=1 Tax=Halapricum sp. CBA1109 TaxID=2668068 RepID=UPI0012F856D8|nr:SDR family oxidoreductase [Halapricum sp. CBA1109]MUV90916.1 SDR family oxidoreductase [Halapricum sp. CBA1109]
MTTDLNGQVALVTGSSRGIGAETARQLADAGADVVVNYLTSDEAAAAVAADVEDTGSDSLVVQADVTDPDAVTSMVSKAESELGTVDILVNNANLPFERKPIAEITWAEMARKIDAELKAALSTTKAVTPGMVEQGHGRLLYVSSGLSKRADGQSVAHGVAKSGLNAFVRYVAEEYGEHGITANTISPGLVETSATSERIDEELRANVSRATPLGRVAQPEDVAATIVAFAGDAGRFTTGTYTPVNGGSRME